ncbi:MAG: MFS transporter [Oscillospiraceae bacterium]
MKPQREITDNKMALSIITAGFGQNMVLTLVSTFLLVYLIEYAKISSTGIAVVTVIMTVIKVFEALNDPIMGTIVDKTHTKRGKFRPFILFSALPVALCTVLIFSLPNTSETLKIVFFTTFYFLWGLSYTACDVPFWGLIGSSFTDKNKRATVVSSVRGAGSVSLGLVTLGAPWLAKLLSQGSETTAQGWSFAAICISVVGMGMFLLAYFNTKEKSHDKSDDVSLKELFKTFISNKPLFLVLISSLIGFGRNIVQVGGAVFAVIAYADEAYFTFIGAAIIAGMVVASFITPLFLKTIGDKALMIYSSLIASVVYVAMYFLGFQNIVSMMICIFITGVTLGIFIVTQTTMVADSVDNMEKVHGIRNDGISFSSLTFVSQMMSTVALLVFGLFLSWIRYEEGVAVTSTMQNSIFFSITIVPAISCLLSIIPILFYKLDSTEQA